MANCLQKLQKNPEKPAQMCVPRTMNLINTVLFRIWKCPKWSVLAEEFFFNVLGFREPMGTSKLGISVGRFIQWLRDHPTSSTPPCPCLPRQPAGRPLIVPRTCEINKQGPEGIVSPPLIISAAPICKHFPQITFKMDEMSPLVHLTVLE